MDIGKRIQLKRWTSKIGIRTKQPEVVSEIEKLHVDIVVFSETKNNDQGEEILRNFCHFWSVVQNLIKEVHFLNERIMQIDISIHEHNTSIIEVYPIYDNALQCSQFYTGTSTVIWRLKFRSGKEVWRSAKS